VAEGNGLAFLDLSMGRPAAPLRWRRCAKAVAAAGGEIREFKAPTRDGMARWISDRAAEREIRISAPAAALLAERIGAFVRERDVDRRRQGEMAVAELEKLALYRLTPRSAPKTSRPSSRTPSPARRGPSSTPWECAASPSRRAVRSARRPAGARPRVHLHRRLRELIQIADLLAAGTPAAALVRTLGLNPYRAEMLANQARMWTQPELDAALAGLLELDATLKGRDGGSDLRRRSAVSLWIAELVRRPGGR